MSVGKGLLLLSFAVAYATIAASQVVPRQCGYERWPVKILSDRDANRVNFNPVDTTIKRLVDIPIHEIPYPQDRRIEPEEFRVYRLLARLVAVKAEPDSDLHVVIAEPENSKLMMIVEIPAPQCAIGTGQEETYAKARQELGTIPIGSIIEMTGVGFFDFLHNQFGLAKNGIELHPVLNIKRRQK